VKKFDNDHLSQLFFSWKTKAPFLGKLTGWPLEVMPACPLSQHDNKVEYVYIFMGIIRIKGINCTYINKTFASITDSLLVWLAISINFKAYLGETLGQSSTPRNPKKKFQF